MAGEFTGKLIADKYRVDERIAASGLGEFYRGTNVLLEKPVSISLLSADLAVDANISSRFFTEAKAAAKISHPNVLNLTDFGTDPSGIAYTIHEAANGETLANAISREGQLPVEMAVDIAEQVGTALSAAHFGGIVHGNLSPANILAASNEPGAASVKVFGFATPNAINTDDAQDAGRFAYLAPEQCAGSDAVDSRGDIYSLGVILFEMLAGSQPFTGTTPTDVMMRHIEEPPPPLSAFRQDLPPAIEPVVIKALAKNPDARYQTADEFIDDLSLAAAGQPLAAAAAPESNNNIWKTAFVVLVGVSLLTIGLIYATSVKQTDPTTALQPDANGMPVQPINPATGIEEQNLLNLPPDYTMFDANTNTAMQPGAYPGGDGNNPWLNGSAPPPGAPAIPPGGQVIQVPGGSPFMADSNCVPQPSGILLCTVPLTPTPAPKTSPTPRGTPVANTNTGTPPAATPTPPRATPTPARTQPTPARTPASSNTPDPTGAAM